MFSLPIRRFENAALFTWDSIERSDESAMKAKQMLGLFTEVPEKMSSAKSICSIRRRNALPGGPKFSSLEGTGKSLVMRSPK
jgi:hypothetical protein